MWRSGVLHLAANRTLAPLRWSFKGLPSGQYTLTFRDQTRKQILAHTSWRLPPRPAWLGSQAGKFGDGYVPHPWMPLKLASRKPLQIGCWGRQYTFAPSGLLSSVHSQGAELLSSPMMWEASFQGRRLIWKPEILQVRRQAKGAIEFTARQSSQGLRLTCSGRMEFDGFVRLQVTLESPHSPVTLDALTLKIPFRKEIARLLHHFPKPSVWIALDMKRFNARAVPPSGWHSPFLYHIWVGDEKKGLQWLCESDKGWRPADPGRTIELLPQGKSVVLKMHLIGKPTPLTRPRRYTFAFQASPVKPMPPDYRRRHYAQVGSYGIENIPYRPNRQNTISYPAAGNFKPEQGTLEITVVPKFDSTAPGELNRSLFSLRWAEDIRPEPEAGIWLYWNQEDKGMRVVVRENNRYTAIYGGRFPWKPGEPHTVAFTWGESGAIYVDRQKIAFAPPKGTLSPGTDLSQARMILGGSDCDFIVRQIRISDIPRPVSDLGAGSTPLAADAHTLLLDRFEHIQGKTPLKQTIPLRSAKEATGLLSPGIHRTASGLDLSNPPASGTVLDYYKSLGLKFIGFHEHWTDWQGYPRTSHTKELRSLLKACHQRGLKLILYHSWQLADIAPEFPLYLKECEVVSPERFLYTRNPKQIDYPVCPRSAWADFMADGIARLFREFRPDGIYSDGLSYPVECSNALHGCGYTGEDGKRHPTVPIFATREAMKRFYRILEQQGRQTLFVCHTSGSITLPTLAFSDAYLDGEHLTGRPRPFRLSLDAFRAEFMGHNFGIPAYFLVYDWNQGMTTPEGLAISLIHDAEVPWSLEAMAPIWKLWKAFQVEKARFIPYWKSKGWLLEAPPGVKVSGYLKPNGEALIVASNLGGKEVGGELKLKMKILAAKEALTGRPVPVSDGVIHDQFPAWQSRLFLAKTKSK